MKKRFTKLLSVILAVLLVAGVFPAAVFTAYADEYDEAQTVAADTFTLFEDVYDLVYLKFVPAVSDVYRFYTENGGGSVEIGIYNDARLRIANAYCNYNTNESEIKDIYLYAENVYYIRLNSYSYGKTFGFYTETQHEFEYGEEDITLAPTCLKEGKANGVCRNCHAEGVVSIPAVPHDDADSDGLCDACGKRLSYTVTEDQPFTFTLNAGDTITLYFTCSLSAVYVVTDNGGYYSREVFDSANGVVYNNDSRYVMTQNETYRIVYTNYEDGSNNEINFTVRHNHVDKGDGTCSICSQQIYKTITPETELEYTSYAKEYTYLAFTPSESGLYRFSNNSENDCTYVMNTRDEEGNDINYSQGCMILEKDKTYVVTMYNYSSSDETAYVMLAHKHTGSVENPGVCVNCGKTFLVEITEGVAHSFTLEPYGALELVFNCTKAGRYILSQNTSSQGVSVESPRDQSGSYENNVDGYYDFATGTSHYYHVYSKNRTQESVTVTLNHKHKVTGSDGKCDICGETVCQTISEGEIAEAIIPASDEFIFRFTAPYSSRYNFFYDTNNTNLRGIYDSNGNFVSHYSSYYYFEKDATYDLYFYSSNGSSGKVKVAFNHDHTSSDGDNLCDICDTEFIIALNEDESENVSVPACNVFYATFTPKYSAAYGFNTTGGLSIDGIYDVYGNYYYSGARLTKDKEYKIKLTAGRFKPIDGTISASHLHEDEDGDGKCDFCGKSCTVTLTEDVPVTVTLASNDSVIIMIECQRTGRYKLISNGPVAVSYLYDDYGGTYSTSDCNLVEGRTYTATIRNVSSLEISQTVTLTHIHTDEDNDTECDICGTVFKYILVTDEEQTVTVTGGESAEFVYVPEKTGNYIFITNGNYNVYDSNNNPVGSYGNDPVRSSSYYHLTANKTYTVTVWYSSSSESGETSINMLATHSHNGPRETIVEAGIATNGVEKLTCFECGEEFCIKLYRTGSNLGEEVSGDFHYRTYDKNGVKEISITSYTGEEEDVVIPSEIDGIPVTDISGFNYQVNSGVKSVVIPDSVRVIEDSSFINTGITSVTIPDSVEIIESAAFIMNLSLETVNIGSGVKFIGKQAFTTCLDDETKAELIAESGEVRAALNTYLEEIASALGVELNSYDELKAYADTHELPEDYKAEIEEILYYVDIYNDMFELYDAAIAVEESSLKTIVYNGTEDDWSKVIIDEDDGTIAGAAFHCLHTATLIVDDEVYATITFSETQESLNLPDVPEKNGYTGTWSEYTLAASDIEITAIYKQNTYYATVKADGNVIDTIPFVYGQKSIALPDVPKKEGYTGTWPNYSLGTEDITIEAVYTVNSYTVTFIKDGEAFSTIEVEYGQAIATPRIPEKKGYEFKGWNPEVPEMMPAKNLEITAVYEPITYYATFIADGEQVGDKVPFTIESETIEAPAVPAKEGYTGEWEEYQLELKDITVNAVYTVNSYKATYLVDGESYMNCLIEYGSPMMRPEEDPEKAGYAFVDWDAEISETMPAQDLVFNALFVPLEYKATFVADGMTVAEVVYTAESKSINEPAVPAKDGYTGVWEAYELAIGGVTVNAVYTINNPTANAKLNVKASQTVDYKANVTVTATAENVPDGYVLAIYEGDILRVKGYNSSVSYKAGTMTASKTFTVKVIDANGNVQKDANGNDLAANCEVKVKSGFFDKLIAFFKGLFGSLPNVEVRP